MIFEFVECDTCVQKPGSPPLCNGCLLNRATIERLKTLLKDRAKTPKKSLWYGSLGDSKG